MSSQTSQTYQKHDIDPRFDSQDSYGRQESCYGNGKYPPDWHARREAVWERQKYTCGRCGTYKGDSAVTEVHHVVHLSNGGSNSLDNLVGLCGDCHALMHPTVDALDGNPKAADIFPEQYADDRVAVLRWPDGNDDLEFDLKRFSETSTPDSNGNAITDLTVPTSAEMARQAKTSFNQILLEHGFVPRISDYHRVSVRPTPSNLSAAIFGRGIELTARSDGTTLEINNVDGDSDALDVYFSSDTEQTKLKIEDPAGDTSTTDLSFDHNSGSRLRLETPISVPPLSAETAPEYAIGCVKYFGWDSLKIGLLPGLVLAFLFPAFVPAGGTIIGTILFIIGIGLLLRIPSIYKDVKRTSTDRIIDERSN